MRSNEAVSTSVTGRLRLLWAAVSGKDPQSANQQPSTRLPLRTTIRRSPHIRVNVLPPPPDPIAQRVQIITAVTALGAMFISGLAIYYNGESVKVGRDQAKAAEAQAKSSIVQADAAQRAQIEERFTAASEGLAGESIDERIGALQSLHRLMRDVPDERRAILESLSVFVRQKSVANAPTAQSARPARGLFWNLDEPFTKDGRRLPWAQPRLDVQMALTVIGSRPGDDRTQVDLSGAFLYGANLRGLNLAEVDLSGSDLGSADASGANFRMAGFAGADLDNAIFKGANLDDVAMDGALLDGASFDGATMRRADLTPALVRDVSFGNTRLEGSKFDGSDMRDSFPKLPLERPVLRDVSLDAAILDGAYLHWTGDLTNASLECASLSDVRLPSHLAPQSPSADCRLARYLRSRLMKEGARPYTFRAGISSRWRPAVVPDFPDGELRPPGPIRPTTPR